MLLRIDLDLELGSYNKPTRTEEGVDMKIKFLSTALAATAGLLVMGSTAHAKKPLAVDCDVLAATNEDVNAFLDGAGVQFRNLGQLVSGAILDDAVFDALHDLILFFSGGTIDFESASQAITTNAKCGLIPQIIENIRD